jgi:hypothetical protein
MQKYTDVVTSVRSGAAKPDARVTVKTYPAGVVATIYSDDGVTTQDNPITTDSNGEFYFYAADGEYTLTVSGTGITERTIGPIILHDPTDADDYMLATDVSFTPSGIATTAHRASRTVNAKLSEVEVSVNDAEGSTDTEKVNRAIAAVSENGGGKVRVPEGSYSWLSVVGKSNVELYLDAGAVVTKNAGASSTHIIDATGTVGTGVDLASNAAIGDASVSADASTGLAAEGWVLIRDDTYVSGTSGRNQEIAQISSISGSGPYTVNLKSRLIGAYTTAQNAQILPLTPVENFHVRGGGKLVIGSGTDGGGFMGVLCVNCTFDGPTVSGPDDDPGVAFEQSYSCVIKNSTVKDGQNTSTGGLGYGFMLNESCHHCRIEHNYQEGVRESLITNRGRFCQIVGNTSVNTYDAAFNTHGSGNEFCLIAGNVITGGQFGVSIGFSSHTGADKNIHVSDNIIAYTKSSGIVVNAPNGTENENVTVTNNKIFHPGLTTASSMGIIMQECLGGLVEGNEVNGNTSSNVSVGVLVQNASDVDVRGNKVHTLTNGVGYRLNGGTNCYFTGNTAKGISSNNFQTLGTNTNCRISDNTADDTTVSIDAAVKQFDNSWNTPTVTNTAVGNVGTGEDDLISRSLNANTLDVNTRGVRITAWGTTANNSNTKEVKLYFGSVAILTTALTVSQAGKWFIEALVFRVAPSTQDYVAKLNEFGATAQTDMENGTTTETDTAAITIKCTGTVTDGGGGVNNNDIVNEGLLVEVLR